MRTMATAAGVLIVLVLTTGAAVVQPAATLVTRWAAEVTAGRVLPDYPRPDLVRRDWQNLNGSWDYAIRDRDADRPATFDGTILVPFPIQSRLSGVARPVSDRERVWYRRTLRADRASGRRWLLHFGAVDWDATVWINSRRVGAHRGGYDPFTLDITDALRPAGEQELVVSVWDPTDRGDQPRGKQVTEPKSIWYTAVTGIWQTVWIEPVPTTYVTGLQIRPDVDAGTVRVRIDAANTSGRVGAHLTVLDDRTTVAEADATAGDTVSIPIRRARLWSPDDPHLYNLRVRLATGDTVDSYFGMRKIAVQPDASGVKRLFLNGRPLFEYGLLDQGWWPDGLYTAPTDAALSSDIETTKRLGFNLIRKHVKVEPARWYYHCDRLGVLVWQDMPSGDNKTADGKEEFARELERVVDSLENHPSIVMWVPFNEGWGQHDTARIVDSLARRDPTRLVNQASGWTDEHVGDVADAHRYPGPGVPAPDARRAGVLGEFGGLGLPLEGHTWLARGNWGYRSFTTTDALAQAYRDLLYQLRIMIGERLSAAIYTQTTDVEIEVNGIMTYDRAVVKLPADAPALHARLYQPPPTLRMLAASSDVEPQRWRYTTDAPAVEWSRADFDDAAWQSAPGGFGTPSTTRVVGTPWTASDIWLRRIVELPSQPLAGAHLRIARDGAVEAWVNGAPVTMPGTVGDYFYAPLASGVLHPGRNVIAIHAHKTRNSGYVDAGVVDVIEEK
jgi:hypothetical protein